MYIIFIFIITFHFILPKGIALGFHHVCIFFFIRFMSIYDVSTYVRARSWLVKFKNMLTFLEYHKDKTPLILYG